MQRANIYVKQGSAPGIYLYTQSKGIVLPKLLKRALERGRERWGDTASLTRIIFAEMMQKDIMSNIGYGISTQLADNENFIIVVDDQIEKIGFFDEAGNKYLDMTFQKFCAMEDRYMEWPNLLRHRYQDARVGPNPNKPDPYPFAPNPIY